MTEIWNSLSVKTVEEIAESVSLSVKALEYKGTIACGANPKYPAAKTGAVYVVSEAGKIGGASGEAVKVGSLLICKETAAEGTQAEVGSKWDILAPEGLYATQAEVATVEEELDEFEAKRGVVSGLAALNAQGAVLSAVAGTNNSALGANTLEANSTGINNTAAGTSVLKANTTGIRNTAIGSTALQANTEGERNTAAGFAALNANTTGKGNTGVGASALALNTTGERNVAVGVTAMDFNETGERNTACGYEALLANKTSSKNTAVGYNALAENNGAENTAVGCLAMGFNNEHKNEGVAAKNVAIGAFAGELNNAELNVFIGYKAGSAETGSNTLYIANSATTEPLIKGNFSEKTLLINGTLEANGLILGAPPGLAEKAEKTEFEPSSKKPSFVTGIVEGATLTRTKIKIKVGANTVSETVISAAQTGVTACAFSFMVPRATKWQWEKVEGTVEKVKTSTAVIG